MNKKLTKKIENSLRQIESINVNELESFVSNTIQIIEELRTVMETGSLKDQKEANHLLVQMQRKFQEILDKNYSLFGFTPKKLESILQPSNYSKEEWAMYQRSQSEIERYKNKLSKEQKN